MSDDSQFRCFVTSCPMTGGIFLNGPNAPGVCAYHHSAAGHEFPRITQLLIDWACVTYEINLWRAAMLSVSIDKDAMARAWTRLQPALGPVWEVRLDPGNLSYAQWGHKLERFLLLRVKETIQRKAEAA